jgi:hypothetical protein
MLCLNGPIGERPPEQNLWVIAGYSQSNIPEGLPKEIALLDVPFEQVVL